MTQKEIAAQLDLSASTLSKYEAGTQLLPLAEFLAWCDALDGDGSSIIATLLDPFEVGRIERALSAVKSLRERSGDGVTVLRATRNGRLLTPRQERVLGLVATGATSRQIAVELGVERRTVENHLSVIMERLGVHDRGAAVAEARRMGILDYSRAEKK